MEKWLDDKHGEKSDLYKDLARLIKLGVEDDWAVNEEVDGRNYRRRRVHEPSADTFYFSITAVYMSTRHPKAFKDERDHIGSVPLFMVNLHGRGHSGDKFHTFWNLIEVDADGDALG